MRQRRETVEHAFGTIKARMGAAHFLTQTLPRVAGEMALHVLASNLTRAMNVMGAQLLLAAIRTSSCGHPPASLSQSHPRGLESAPFRQKSRQIAEA